MKKLPRHVVEINRRVQNKYFKALKRARITIMGIANKEHRKTLEQEVAHIVNQVDSYGFSFFPDVYVIPLVEELKAISQ